MAFLKAGSAVVAMNPNRRSPWFLCLPRWGKFMRGFTNQEYQKFWKTHLYRFLTELFPALTHQGSTVKPMVALAALEEKVIDEKTGIS